jgi:hypothetical protein
MVGTFSYLGNAGFVQEYFAALDVHVYFADAAQATLRRRGQVNWHAPGDMLAQRQDRLASQQQVAHMGCQESIDLAPGDSRRHIDFDREVDVHL